MKKTSSKLDTRSAAIGAIFVAIFGEKVGSILAALLTSFGAF